MELKWLEDFVCIVSEAHFSRAAAVRRVTQSALSRRMKALESWVGEELLDRSGHPIQLTEAGVRFLPVAKHIISEAYESRAELRSAKLHDEREVVVGSLHTLALFELPNRIAALHRDLKPFSVRVIAETKTLAEYIDSLEQGESDFFLCYSHPEITTQIDPSEILSLNIGRHEIAPYVAADAARPDLESAHGPPIPYLRYSGTSLLAKATEIALTGAGFLSRLQVRFEASLAESLHTAALAGLGVAWLPDRIGDRPQAGGKLVRLPTSAMAGLSVRLYMSAENDRAVVREIWQALCARHQDDND